MQHIKIFVMTQRSQIWCFFKFNILLNVWNITKNVILGANNTPNLPLKLMYFFCFWSYRPAKYVKSTKILFCIKFQLWTIFFETTTMSKIDFDTLGAILGGRGVEEKIVHNLQMNPSSISNFWVTLIFPCVKRKKKYMHLRAYVHLHA